MYMERMWRYLYLPGIAGSRLQGNSAPPPAMAMTSLADMAEHGGEISWQEEKNRFTATTNVEIFSQIRNNGAEGTAASS